MKAQFVSINKDLLKSFSIRRDVSSGINNKWHYHLETELIYFKKGSGTQFVGDSVRRFQEGDLVLLGKNLPHYWQFDHSQTKNARGRGIEAYVIHFHENFWGGQFLDLPETSGIKNLLKEAELGVHLDENQAINMDWLFEELINAEGIEVIILLLTLLKRIWQNEQRSILNQLGPMRRTSQLDQDRINAIYDYTVRNYQDRITLGQVSEIISISRSSFCRYFKSCTGKDYSTFLNEVRMNAACKLLAFGSEPIKEITYLCGFFNLSNFYRSFKVFSGTTPCEYRNKFSENRVNNTYGQVNARF